MKYEWERSIGGMIATRKPKYSEQKHLSQCHFVHYKSHMYWIRIESESPLWKRLLHSCVVAWPTTSVTAVPAELPTCQALSEDDRTSDVFGRRWNSTCRLVFCALSAHCSCTVFCRRMSEGKGSEGKCVQKCGHKGATERQCFSADVRVVLNSRVSARLSVIHRRR
jgi:hypothetical protein